MVCQFSGYFLWFEQGSHKKLRFTWRCSCGVESLWLYKTAAQARAAVLDHQSGTEEEPAEEEENGSEEDSSGTGEEDSSGV